jgi:hypothetical protein
VAVEEVNTVMVKVLVMAVKAAEEREVIEMVPVVKHVLVVTQLHLLVMVQVLMLATLAVLREIILEAEEAVEHGLTLQALVVTVLL